MPQSMTGFGVAQGDVQDGRLRVEIRTVNHRHLTPHIKLPDDLAPLESDVRDLIRTAFARGHVTVSMRWSERPVPSGTIRLNVERAKEILAAIRELQAALSLDSEIDIAFLARHPDILSSTDDELPPIAWAEVAPIVEEACRATVDVRRREGEALSSELASILETMVEHVNAIDALAPLRLEREHQRLKEAVARLAEGIEVDETRLAQELAFAADRRDITEELSRLRMHVTAAHHALASDGPVGKQLGFLSQEFLREINTIGSKANDAEITGHVIASKGEIEKFREQVENVE